MKRVLFVLALLALATPALAQTKPVNPTSVEWTDPNDYATVTSWQVGFFVSGATTPVQTPVDLGKPALVTTGCTVSPCLKASINTQPVPFGMNYVARIRTVVTVSGAPLYSEWSDEGTTAFFERRPGKPGGTVVK